MQSSELQILRKLRLKYPRNPLLGYLNINSVKNKITDVREMIGRLQLDYFVISDTKLDSSFPSAQFHIGDYEIRNRRNRDKSGGELIEFVKKGIITKRHKDLQTNLSEAICMEITISKKRWFCMSVYRPPSSSNIDTFFDELTISLSKAVNKFDNLVIMGDFNIDITKHNCSGFDKLKELCDTFNFTNLIKSETCYINNHKSTIDLFFTIKPLSFQGTSSTETGLSYCHKLISTFVRSFISPLKPKNVIFQNYKKFDETKFLSDLKNTNFSFTSADPNEIYLFLTNSFSQIVEKHIPLKKKTLRGNHPPFFSKELGKAIYTKSRFRNRYLKNPDEIDRKLYKQQRNTCASIQRKSIKHFFSNTTSNGIITNKNFWKAKKRFLTNKGSLENSDIMLRGNFLTIITLKLLNGPVVLNLKK